MIFRCTLSKSIKYSTVLITLLIVIVVVKVSFVLPGLLEKSAVTETVLLLLIILFFIALYIATLTFVPKTVKTDDQFLTISRIFSDVKIPFKEIKEAYRYASSRADTRRFGSNGLWGYLGILENREFKYLSFDVNSQNAVMLKCGEKNYLISCDSPDELLQVIKERS